MINLMLELNRDEDGFVCQSFFFFENSKANYSSLDYLAYSNRF